VTPVAWMVGVGLALWAGVEALGGEAVTPEARYGLAAPLVCGVGSWLVTARVHASDPARVTGALLLGFGAKALVFGAYVALAVRGLGLRPVPFALSFAGFFIATYAMEAIFLRRLFAGDVRSVGQE
jgi:hypothetical protein